MAVLTSNVNYKCQDMDAWHEGQDCLSWWNEKRKTYPACPWDADNVCESCQSVYGQPPMPPLLEVTHTAPTRPELDEPGPALWENHQLREQVSQLKTALGFAKKMADEYAYELKLSKAAEGQRSESGVAKLPSYKFKRGLSVYCGYEGDD